MFIAVFLAKVLGLTVVFYAVMSPWKRKLREVDARPVRVGLSPWSSTADGVVRLAITPAPVPPKPLRPDPPEPNDPIEQRFVARLREHPDDRDSRLVYGDWLEDHGEEAKANFVRGTESLADLARLVETTGVAWRAAMYDERVACMTPLCPDRWSAFEVIAQDTRHRRCPRCRTAMYYAASRGEVEGAIARGERAILDLTEVAQPPRGFDTTDVR